MRLRLESNLTFIDIKNSYVLLSSDINFNLGPNFLKAFAIEFSINFLPRGKSTGIFHKSDNWPQIHSIVSEKKIVLNTFNLKITKLQDLMMSQCNTTVFDFVNKLTFTVSAHNTRL